jgi:hypothetical protein
VILALNVRSLKLTVFSFNEPLFVVAGFGSNKSEHVQRQRLPDFEVFLWPSMHWGKGVSLVYRRKNRKYLAICMQKDALRGCTIPPTHIASSCKIWGFTLMFVLEEGLIVGATEFSIDSLFFGEQRDQKSCCLGLSRAL